MQKLRAPVNLLKGVSLKGKHCLITGGSQGLGKQIARQFIDAGAKVAVCARSQSIGTHCAEELGCEFIQADISKVSECKKFVEEAYSKFGQIDCLINAAGLTDRGNLKTTDEELYDKMFDTNLKGPFFLSQAVAEHMKPNCSGSIINISSVASHGGATFITPYSMTKGALNIMTKLNATELRQYGIRVNSIAMGWTLTDNEDKLQKFETGNENWLADAESRHPMGRLLRPEDIANMALYLACDASVMVTGTVVEVHPEMILGMMPGGIGE